MSGGLSTLRPLALGNAAKQAWKTCTFVNNFTLKIGAFMLRGIARMLASSMGEHRGWAVATDA